MVALALENSLQGHLSSLFVAILPRRIIIPRSSASSEAEPRQNPENNKVPNGKENRQK